MFGDFIEASQGAAIEDVVNQSPLRDSLRTVILETLTRREVAILVLRYGLSDGCSLTLRQVADPFGLTRERVRQIEKGALEKLRQSEWACKLADFLR